MTAFSLGLVQTCNSPLMISAMMPVRRSEANTVTKRMKIVQNTTKKGFLILLFRSAHDPMKLNRIMFRLSGSKE